MIEMVKLSKERSIHGLHQRLNQFLLSSTNLVVPKVSAAREAILSIPVVSLKIGLF